MLTKKTIFGMLHLVNKSEMPTGALMKLFFVFYKGEATISELRNIPEGANERTVRRHIGILLDRGYIEKKQDSKLREVSIRVTGDGALFCLKAIENPFAF